MGSQAKQAVQAGWKEKPFSQGQPGSSMNRLQSLCPGTTWSDLRADLMLSWRLDWTHSQIPSKYSSTILQSLIANQC